MRAVVCGLSEAGLGAVEVAYQAAGALWSLSIGQRDSAEGGAWAGVLRAMQVSTEQENSQSSFLHPLDGQQPCPLGARESARGHGTVGGGGCQDRGRARGGDGCGDRGCRVLLHSRPGQQSASAGGPSQVRLTWLWLQALDRYGGDAEVEPSLIETVKGLSTAHDGWRQLLGANGAAALILQVSPGPMPRTSALFVERDGRARP
jgi:hypothetical protein